MQRPMILTRGGARAEATPVPPSPRLSRCCCFILLLLSLCSCAHATAVRRVGSESQSLRSLVQRHGGFVHADLRLSASSASPSSSSDGEAEAALNLGVFTAAALPPHTVLLSVPHSMALTGERAFESLSALLSEEQMAAVLDIQADSCDWIDWMMILYIALADAFADEPAWCNPTGVESLFAPICPAPFFPLVDPAEASFPSSLHALWSHMIALYPRDCVGAICIPLRLSIVEALNEPLLLRRNHMHVQCVIQARAAIPQVEAILAHCPSRLPLISRERMQWAASMLLSRQQSIAAPSSSSSSASSTPPARTAALLPLFDLFNTLPSAANQSQPRIYRTQDITLAPPTPGAAPDAATQAVTRDDDIPSGSELFDLYGGADPAPNLDLLVFYGFVPPDNAAASVTLTLGFCVDDADAAGDSRSQRPSRTAVLLSAVDRMYTLFSGAPLDLRPHLSSAEMDRYAPWELHATGASSPSSSFRFSDCPSSRARHMLQSVLSTSGVSVTLITLARLLVSTHAQLSSASFLSSLLQPGAKSPLDARAEQQSLQLMLDWLLTAADATHAEWMHHLQCAAIVHADRFVRDATASRADTPSRPLQMHVSVLTRQADNTTQVEVVPAAMRAQLCNLKAAHMDVIQHAAQQLRHYGNLQ